jgi:hypothetical protein
MIMTCSSLRGATGDRKAERCPAIGVSLVCAAACPVEVSGAACSTGRSAADYPSDGNH